jgi:hypothetical protein
MWTLENSKISKKIKFLLVSIFLSTPIICLTLYSYYRSWSMRTAKKIEDYKGFCYGWGDYKKVCTLEEWLDWDEEAIGFAVPLMLCVFMFIGALFLSLQVIFSPTFPMLKKKVKDI